MEVICSDDSEVNESFPNTNYGAEAIISVGRTGDNFTCSYIALNISDKPSNFIKVQLAVNLCYSGASDQDYELLLVEVNTYFGGIWSETNITWNNKPEFYELITSFKVNTTSQSKTYLFDMTNHTDEGFKYISLAFEPIEEGECNCLSKEYFPSNSSDAPRLILFYLDNQLKIPFSDFSIIGLIITFGIAVKIIKMKCKKQT